MYKEFDRKFDQRALDAEEGDSDDVCRPGIAPAHPRRGIGFMCSLTSLHEDTHLAGTGGGYVIAEWDDDRSTDIFE